MPRDAEQWLAERGIHREPLVVDSPVAHPDEPSPPVEHQPPPSRESPPAAPARAEADAAVAKGLAFVRRSASVAPQSEQRLADKLADRGNDEATIAQVMDAARAEGLVNDEAMVAALIGERRAKGHGVSRIRRDLLERAFPRALVEQALVPLSGQDPEAMAFDVARARAEQLATLDTMAAFRRVANYVARRGYPDGLARKVAREAVFATREDDRIAGH